MQEDPDYNINMFNKLHTDYLRDRFIHSLLGIILAISLFLIFGSSFWVVPDLWNINPEYGVLSLGVYLFTAVTVITKVFL